MFRRNKPKQSKELYTFKINYPSGSCIKITDGILEGSYLYKIKGRWFKFGSVRAYQSWSLLAADALSVNVNGIDFAGVLGFREGSLLSKFSDGTLHVVSNNKTRHIVDPDALDKYGLLGRTIWEVSDNEFNLHDIGDKLSG